MNLISVTDLVDLYHKIHERGVLFILDKFSFSRKKRVYNTWKNVSENSSSWWIIESVQRRWNEKITGDPAIAYEIYVTEHYFQHQNGLTLLSVGCGTGSHEIKFAETRAFKKIIGLDIAPGPLRSAMASARELKLDNVEFVESSFEDYSTTQKFDVVLFHSSLHHFQDIYETLEKANLLLSEKGIVIINEYVGPNRLQFSKERINSINEALKKIPIQLKKRQFTGFYKNKVYAPGLLRMIVADPSEACSSENILAALHEGFTTLEEKKIGGDILHLLLKDIAHNFLPETTETTTVLKFLFDYEDEYIKSKDHADFMFGIYKKKQGPGHKFHA